jgi:hypothetical protein
MFEIKPSLFLIGTITLSEEMISLLSVGVSKIRSTEKSNPEQGTSD